MKDLNRKTSNAQENLEVQNGAALEGIRVVDLTQFEAGTSCTQMLAWLGAEVIKVEEPTRGEQGRSASRDDSNADSFYFLMLNCNKKSVTANLKSEQGLGLVRSLIAKADVFIENFAPGVIERLGLDYERVKALNSRIVYAQIKGYSPSGPFSSHLSFDMIAQAVGGSLSITGEAEGKPLRPGLTIGDTGAGIHCAMGILAALYQRRSTGRGQRVEVAMQEAITNFARISYARQLMGKAPCPRAGNQSILGTTSPSEAYRCKGGGPNDYCFVYTSRSGSGDDQWERLLRIIGREDLAGSARFDSPEKRWANKDEVDEIITAWTIQRDKHEVMKLLGDAGVPAGAVLSTEELMNDTHLRERGVFATFTHPARGEVTVPGWPVRMSESKVSVTSPPLLGESNCEVYGELLGLAPEEIEALRRAKVI